MFVVLFCFLQKLFGDEDNWRWEIKYYNYTAEQGLHLPTSGQPKPPLT